MSPVQITHQSDDWRLPLNTASGFSNPPSLGSTSVHSSLNIPPTVAAKGGPHAHDAHPGHPSVQQKEPPASVPPAALALEPSAVSLAPTSMQQQQPLGSFGLYQGGMAAENDGKLATETALRERVCFTMQNNLFITQDCRLHVFT